MMIKKKQNNISWIVFCVQFVYLTISSTKSLKSKVTTSCSKVLTCIAFVNSSKRVSHPT